MKNNNLTFFKEKKMSNVQNRNKSKQNKNYTIHTHKYVCTNICTFMKKEKKRKLMHPSNINIRNSLFASTFETNLDGGIRCNYDDISFYGRK